jgi:hypothetical protein
LVVLEKGRADATLDRSHADPTVTGHRALHTHTHISKALYSLKTA